jgi:hypothetical protein
MPIRFAAPLVRAFAPVACAAAYGCGLITWPLPSGVVRFTPPPVYARWWAMTEACSGITRPLAAVQFYRVPHVQTISAPFLGDVAGYYARGSNRIVLAGFFADEGATVRHEMLHALLNKAGHPRAQFLGRCAGIVNCVATCVTEAGPLPASELAAVRVEPEALEISAEVAPAVPSLAVDSGLFTVTFRIHNPAPYSVVIVPPPPPGGPFPAQPVRFHFGISRVGGGGFSPDATAGPADPIGYVYDAGETRQKVYDLSLDTTATGGYARLAGRGVDPVLGPGQYTFRGYYGNSYGRRWSDSVTISFTP